MFPNIYDHAVNKLSLVRGNNIAHTNNNIPFRHRSGIPVVRIESNR